MSGARPDGGGLGGQHDHGEAARVLGGVINAWLFLVKATS